MDGCVVAGLLTLPGGNCAQWFSGSASAAAVCIALAGYFVTELVRRRERRARHLEDIALAAATLTVCATEVRANLRCINTALTTIKVGGQEFVITTKIGGVDSQPVHMLDGSQTRSFIEVGAAELVGKINLAVRQANHSSTVLSQYLARREAFSNHIDEVERVLQAGVAEEISKHEPVFQYHARIMAADVSNTFQTLKSINDELSIAISEFNQFCENYLSGGWALKVDVEGLRAELDDEKPFVIPSRSAT